jgi:hypothetical protein
VIGLGPMGRAMAATLLKAGHPVTVWNRTPSRAETLVAAGATPAPTPADAVAASGLTILSLTDNQAMHDILDGSVGALAGDAHPPPAATSDIGSDDRRGHRTATLRGFAAAPQPATIPPTREHGERDEGLAGDQPVHVHLPERRGGTERSADRGQPAPVSRGSSLRVLGCGCATASRQACTNAFSGARSSSRRQAIERWAGSRPSTRTQVMPGRA